MAKLIACPYCYETFSPRKIKFRCNSRLSRSNKRCAREHDPVLAARRSGATGETGIVFEADGRRSTALCPTCDNETTYRICPICHNTLPAQFGMVENKLIAMVGARNSGKTVFMTVLLHELMNRVGENFGSALMPADDETTKRFGTDYENTLYREGRLMGGTSSAAAVGAVDLSGSHGADLDSRVDPLVFRFGLTRQTLLGPRPQNVVLSFFDTAGEDFNSLEKVQVHTRYLANADGIILVMDPLQMPGARAQALPGTLLPGAENTEAAENVLNRVTEMLLARSRKNALISTPVAVVFSKMDALWHTLERGSRLAAQPSRTGRFDVADSRDVHEEVRDLLRTWHGVSLDQTLRTGYARYRYFGVSALGRTPTADSRVARTGIQPYRVTEPLLWLLSEFGSVPKQGRG
ncbi:hypothetical protein [Streptomyces sp. RKAG293]|uniref:hypothetical protein n=1 Tax=Streptomyces sp. RKAG293 TaxID=2893403 RepID=UPI0020337410|nr:hypothetical protein [Streptomyces sp. RKAG293]MCM2422614.1 hypothetical protein [Streptomyces sp. RKAG293]